MQSISLKIHLFWFAVRPVMLSARIRTNLGGFLEQSAALLFELVFFQLVQRRRQGGQKLFPAPVALFARHELLVAVVGAVRVQLKKYKKEIQRTLK